MASAGSRRQSPWADLSGNDGSGGGRGHPQRGRHLGEQGALRVVDPEVDGHAETGQERRGEQPCLELCKLFVQLR